MTFAEPPPPPLSEFETFVMGLLSLSIPPPLPIPRSESIRVKIVKYPSFESLAYLSFAIFLNIRASILSLCKFIYLGFYIAFNTIQVGHITTGSWEGRGNQCIQLVKFLYCKLPTNGKQLPAFPLEAWNRTPISEVGG